MSKLTVSLPVLTRDDKPNLCSIDCAGLYEPYPQELHCAYFQRELVATIPDSAPSEYRGKYVSSQVPDVARCLDCIVGATLEVGQ
jgi:hypothetical protein